MSESASMLLFGDEQIALPGIPPSAASPPVAESPPAQGGIPQCPGQLCLGPLQLLLADADPEPLQPSLLPDPPPWELAEGSGRPEQHPSTADGGGPASPDPRATRQPQLGLFPRHR